MKIKYLTIISSCLIFTACSQMNYPRNDNPDWIYPVSNPYEPEIIEHPKESQPLPKFVKTAEAPQTQVSAKNADLGWIYEQNPKNYTIIVASDTKPLQVSQSLMQTPKTQRSAAFKYQQNGVLYYSGVYGSYAQQSDAQMAMQQLPAELQSQARIVEWSSIQTLNHL